MSKSQVLTETQGSQATMFDRIKSTSQKKMNLPVGTPLFLLLTNALQAKAGTSCVWRGCFSTDRVVLLLLAESLASAFNSCSTQ